MNYNAQKDIFHNIDFKKFQIRKIKSHFEKN